MKASILRWLRQQLACWSLSFSWASLAPSYGASGGSWSGSKGGQRQEPGEAKRRKGLLIAPAGQRLKDVAYEKFAEEYVDRCTELRQVLHERCREIESMEEALREVRDENRVLREALARAEGRNRAPERICVATSRGERYHLPNCGNIRRSTELRVYTPCRACLGG